MKLVLAVAILLAPSAAALPAPSSNCSPGFGGGVFCWIWVGNGCEIETYAPPNPLFPGPGDPLPYARAYGCVVTCYADVEQGGEQCVLPASKTCSLRVRTGALPDDRSFGQTLPSVETSGCALP